MRRPSFLSRCSATEKYLNARLSLTTLEDRVNPGVSASFQEATGRLEILEDGSGADTDIKVVVSTSGTISVTNNGVEVPIGGDPISQGSNSVRGLKITGGTGKDNVDLTAIDRNHFPNLDSKSNPLAVNALFLGLAFNSTSLIHPPLIDVNLGGGDDTFVGGQLPESVEGGDGNDILQGNDGSDVLDGNAGDDVIRGGGDNDEIYGGDGADSLFGDAGDDTFPHADSADKTLDGGLGNNRMRFSKKSGENLNCNIVNL